MEGEEGIPFYFPLCLSVRRSAPHLTDDYRFDDTIKFAASLDVMSRDLKDAVFLLDVFYDDTDIIGPDFLDDAGRHEQKVFIITYTLDNVDVRIHAYRERVYHLVNYIFGMDYPIQPKQQRDHPEVKDKTYFGAIH